MEKAKILQKSLNGFKTLFRYTVDSHQGVRVSQDSLPKDKDRFGSQMASFIAELKRKQARSIWISIPIEKSGFIETAASLGFEFHHTKGSVLTMSQWLEEDSPNRLPGYATHYAGVGGLVVNDQEEALLVQETHPYKGEVFWKLPGGQVDANETLKEAVVREVKEETGIKAKVEGVITFRENPCYLFQTHDLYFVFLMSCIKADNTIQKQTAEIAKCEWVPFKHLPEKMCVLSPMAQRIALMINGDLQVANDLLREYKDEGSSSLLELGIMSNQPYEFKEITHDLYMGKMIRECIEKAKR
ncbi:unnamed protein product [Moneuplotes crassus]|uniref:Nudix hydrolase domain-containing protein n=1 Tax=Euplotes crassus TaxID=5936 RepID=A0AAD1XS43_EUPCR|nr:unnamed protein product [Moneuplotes crassus]